MILKKYLRVDILYIHITLEVYVLDSIRAIVITDNLVHGPRVFTSHACWLGGNDPFLGRWFAPDPERNRLKKEISFV